MYTHVIFAFLIVNFEAAYCSLSSLSSNITEIPSSSPENNYVEYIPPPPPPPTSSEIYESDFEEHPNSTVKMENHIRNEMASSIDEFAANIYEAIIEKTGDGSSLIMSPFSVQTALSLLYCGAAGKTAAAMQSVLQLSDLATVQDVANNFYYLLLPFENNAIVEVANGIYVNEGYNLQSTYQSVADNQFFSAVSNVNFAENTVAAQTINDYVSNETHGKITNLVSPDSLSVDTGMVVVNAIYFNGRWNSPFQPEDTVIGKKFHTSSTTTTLVDMMGNYGVYRYLYMKDIAVKVTKIDYKNSDMSLVVFLPDSYDGLAKLEANMASFNYTKIIRDSRSAYVSLSLPKFEIGFNMSLKKTLIQMGLDIIFDQNNADFSGLVDVQSSSSDEVQPLYVSDVIHKAYIKVDEQGTVAAAATAVENEEDYATPPLPIPNEVFNANHPFTFALANKFDVIFIGRYVGV